ncbi:hypothetical protein R5W24_001232 [Gemmata sp. JC717]|uniref:hypothetical protein n=1 Tax=Gemmata algarum TaxID=2975278 RepID=UPI0021BA7E33|nr:hypothetical protein [Gemmata algarum]MDY3552152.1 hypothetical protein [Gemmata algarum]
MPPFFRNPWTFILLMACATVAVAGAADPTPEEIKEGERLFRDVYGKEYDRVGKGKAALPADRVAFGKKLWDAACDSRSNPGLFRVLLNKSLPLTLADPIGYPTAIKIRRTQLTEGKERPEQLAALAAVLDRAARAEKPEQRAKYGAELVEVYREAADACYDLGRDADAVTFWGKAKAAAGAHLPPAVAAPLVKEIATDQAECESHRKHAADLKRFTQALQDRADDPKANLGMGLLLLRDGKEAAAAKHLALATVPDLKTAGELLTAQPVPFVKVGDAFRSAGENVAGERALLLGWARRCYEAALASDPRHPDAARLKLLIKELPSLRSFTPTGIVAVLDEEKSVADALGKSEGVAKILWSGNGYAGSGCLEVRSGVPKQAEQRGGAVEGWKFALAEWPNPGEYRYLRFAIRVTDGTHAFVNFGRVTYTVGKSDLNSRAAFSVAEKVPDTWLVVTRDLVLDVGESFPLSELRVGTDGAVQIDAVYLGRTRRELGRYYPKPLERK